MVRIKPQYTPRRRRSEGGFRPLRMLVVFAVLAVAAFFGYRRFVGYTLDRANRYFEAHQDQEAQQLFKRVANLPFTKGLGNDGLGTLALLSGDDANPYFDRILDDNPSGYGIDPGLALDRLIQEGWYLRGKAYRDFLISWKSTDDLREYFTRFATLALGTRELAEARRMLSNVGPATRSSQHFKELETVANGYEQTGLVPVVLDVKGRTIVAYNLEKSVHEYGVPRLFAGWPKAGDAPGELLGGLDTRDKLNRIVTTIDLDLQRSAYQAMKNHKGTMVILEPHLGHVLAAYGSAGLEPFTKEYEPGSVIKLITYAYYLQNGGRVENFVPKRYPSSERIGDRIFYDWTEHGMIETIDEAMAVSCNLIFAHMGIEMGWPRTRSGLKRFLDGDVKPTFFTPARFGRIRGEPADEFELGRAAIGLDFTSATALGLAMIPATIANQGSMPNVKLIARKVTLDGNAYEENPDEKGHKIFSTDTTDKLTHAMVRAVEDARGTARRVDAGDLTAAVKTGTAGERPYNAVIVGLLPADAPKLAFAFILDGGGKAEYKGAEVATQLIGQIRVQAPAYLE